jgi:hypothetical protein
MIVHASAVCRAVPGALARSFFTCTPVGLHHTTLNLLQFELIVVALLVISTLVWRCVIVVVVAAAAAATTTAAAAAVVVAFPRRCLHSRWRVVESAQRSGETACE